MPGAHQCGCSTPWATAIQAGHHHRCQQPDRQACHIAATSPPVMPPTASSEHGYAAHHLYAPDQTRPATFRHASLMLHPITQRQFLAPATVIRRFVPCCEPASTPTRLGRESRVSIGTPLQGIPIQYITAGLLLPHTTWSACPARVPRCFHDTCASGSPADKCLSILQSRHCPRIRRDSPLPSEPAPTGASSLGSG
jgi:hypothetical protein